MEIKETLISIRESNGYSKRTVSEMTGIPYTTYIKYESGERKDVSMQALCKLADFYNVTTDYLLGRETDNPFEGISLDKEDIELFKAFAMLPSNIRKCTLQLLVELIKEVQESKN